jgi:hypothetical protein
MRGTLLGRSQAQPNSNRHTRTNITTISCCLVVTLKSNITAQAGARELNALKICTDF